MHNLERSKGLLLPGVPSRESAGNECEPRPRIKHLTQNMSDARVAIFDEKYRVVAVESQSLTIRGVRSGEVLTIINPDPDTPLTPAEYPPGKLIALE